MAMYAAHLTRTSQGTPSVFQIAAQETLGATVKPAIQKVIEYLAAKYPNKFTWCMLYYDELYMVCDCFLQYHYLKHYAASFSETFYGLLRVPIRGGNEFSSGSRLPHKLELGSLALLVLVPYLRDKVERIVEKWREDDEDGKMGKNITDRLRKAMIKFYAVLYMVCELVKLVHLARYLTGGSRAPTPALAILGLALTNAPAKDEQYTWSDLAKIVLNGRLGLGMLSFPMVGALLLRSVEYGAFVVQLLRWWEAEAITRLRGNLPVPPPPERDENALKLKNRCPICLQKWKIATVLPVSGYTFCYVCISKHMRKYSACPITGLPATEDSLIRMYVDR